MSEDYERAFPANAAQAAYWNVDMAGKWVGNQARLDRLFRTITAKLIERAEPRPGERVLDVGCGTGATTLELAEAVGPEGRVFAIDISEPMLAVARRRIEAAGHRQVEPFRADAQSHRFGPASIDLIASRFGVMFFSDPVAAFANLRSALKPDGRIAFACWTEVEANPWFWRPFEIAVRHLGQPEKKHPHAPGPFAFADGGRVRGILAAAGFGAIQVERTEVDMVSEGSIEEEAAFASTMGLAARLIRERAADRDAAARTIEGEVADAFRPFASEGSVRYPAVVFLVTARPG